MHAKQNRKLQKRLLNMLEDIERDISSGSSSASDSEISGFDDLEISDISSIPSEIFTNPLKSTPKRQIPQKSMITVEKKSRIPVRTKTRIEEIKRAPQEQETKKSQNYPSIQLSEQAENSKPRIERVINFLAVDFTKYSHCLVCVYKGTGFPKMRNGERSTYVVVKLHEKLNEDVTPVCWRKTNDALYNAGYKHDVTSLNFDGTTPHIEVFDMHMDNTHEFIGMGFIQLQMAKIVGNVCVVYKDEWIPIFMEESDSERGKVLMTVIFYNNEEDIVGMVRNPAEEIDDESPVKTKAKVSPQVNSSSSSTINSTQTSNQEATKEPLKSSAAVQADTADSYITEDPLLSTAGDFTLKYEKPKPWKELPPDDDLYHMKNNKQDILNLDSVNDDSEMNSSFMTRKQHKKKVKKPKMIFMDASDLDLDMTQPIAPPPPQQQQQKEEYSVAQKQTSKPTFDDFSSSSSFISQDQPVFKTRKRSKRNDQNQPPKQATTEQQKPFSIYDDDPLKFNIFAPQIRKFNQ